MFVSLVCFVLLTFVLVSFHCLQNSLFTLNTFSQTDNARSDSLLQPAKLKAVSADKLLQFLTSSLRSDVGQDGRRQQRCQQVGGAPPASDALSTTLGVAFLCIKDVVSREYFASPTTSDRSWKRLQRLYSVCISNFARRIDQFLRHHRVSMLRPHWRIAPLFGNSAAHDAFIANSDFRKDWNPTGGNQRKW